MFKEKTISNQAKEDFFKNLTIPIKGDTFSINSIVENKPVKLVNLSLRAYKSILDDPNTDSLISLVNTLTNGLLYSKFELKNKPRKIHYQIR